VFTYRLDGEPWWAGPLTGLHSNTGVFHFIFEEWCAPLRNRGTRSVQFSFFLKKTRNLVQFQMGVILHR
jgi:hypothetical protein